MSNFTLNLKKFPNISRTQINEVRHYVTPSGALPSVTSILSATSDKSGILAWREAIGAKKADEIVKKSTNIGSLMHNSLEKFLLGESMVTGSNPIRVHARQMAEIMVERNLKGRLTEIYGLEANLFYEGLWSGCTDCVGIYDGQLSIVDFKNARKEKKEEYIHDYKLQICAYALAYEHLFGEPVNQGVILVVTQDFKDQKFILNKQDMDKYKNEWIDRVEQYYNS